MSLAHKLYQIGQHVTNEDIRNIIESPPRDVGSYVTLQIDFVVKSDGVKNVYLKKASLDTLKTMFTKKIGGTSNSYYLYPNFEFQKENDLYKKFKAARYTLENSILVFADKEHQKVTELALEYIQKYQEDILNFKSYPKDNYLMVFTINGVTFAELMPEVWENYLDDFVDAHISIKEKGEHKDKLYEAVDFITGEKVLCGYNPNVKFFTMDNYHDNFKPQIIDKLPMSKETATLIKKGWMYAITHLKFNYKGLEYIIIPSMVTNHPESYKRILKYLNRSSGKLEQFTSKEDSFIRRLSAQIEDFDEALIHQISLDILFTEVNLTNLSVKIFATLEDVLPSRINSVVKTMKEMQINANIKREENSSDVYLRDYFSREELFAVIKKNTSQMKHRIVQEKIFLAKLLLGYETITRKELLKRFKMHREYDFQLNKRLTDSRNKDAKVKEWLEYPQSFVKNEDVVLNFLDAIQALRSNHE